ncbi:MAG: glycosyltransferase family 1 protein [Chloroflexi bacterium]|nr:glycosyltransferase family 1 protein [Chloroflexota bacterium]OJV89621.1 MAG: hypothetical protein BGO39_37330 [Chloroflexi bacterium 54-19]
MKFIILDHYYDIFLRAFYNDKRDIFRDAYDVQLRQLMDQCFGTADFYSENLKLLGHEAEDIVINCEPLQKQWAKEHGIKVNTHKPKIVIRRRKGVPVPSLRFNKDWLRLVVLAQIKTTRPDVLYVQDPWSFYNLGLLKEVRPYVKLLVCQHASTLPPADYFKGFDLVVSSLPNQIEFFRSQGLKSEYLAIGFEPRVLKILGEVKQQYQVVHIGGYKGVHEARADLLEKVARACEIQFWGYGIENLPPGSPIREQFNGEAWALDMYRTKAASRITLTFHSTASGVYANNMSLFETTGVGSLLLTDNKKNLGDLFEIGKEVIAYENADDCIEKIRYYLDHENERAAIAANGQKRTLKEHTYFHRMQQLLDILKKYL